MNDINLDKIKNFYLGKRRTPEGFSFEDIMNFNSVQFELHHHFIQWLFPIETPSFYNISAPILTKEEAVKLGECREVRKKMIQAFQFVCKMYELDIVFEEENIHIIPGNNFSGWWLTKNNHNHLRITRILKCLTNVGLKKYAIAFLQLLESLYKTNSEGITKKTMEFWKNAIND